MTGRDRFPDGAEVIILYDKADNCFGYAVNRHCPDSSDWGYAPFCLMPQSTTAPRYAVA